MVAIKGHFDGKVIVPDEPVRLVPNQRLIVTIQVVEDRKTDFTSWIGLGNQSSLNPTPRFRSDSDLWE
jgi:hypothetical protein